MGLRSFIENVKTLRWIIGKGIKYLKIKWTRCHQSDPQNWCLPWL